MNFEITSDARGIEIYKGMIITYKVSPLLKIRMNWATEISNVEKPHFFVDDQKSGPFKYWHHQHFFKEIEGGVLIEDIVSYEAPILGSIIEGLLVNKRVDAIFEFRKKKLEEIFDTF
jgi:ligand-binding SRPBCC domain-containing protein